MTPTCWVPEKITNLKKIKLFGGSHFPFTTIRFISVKYEPFLTKYSGIIHQTVESRHFALCV